MVVMMMMIARSKAQSSARGRRETREEQKTGENRTRDGNGCHNLRASLGEVTRRDFEESGDRLSR